MRITDFQPTLTAFLKVQSGSTFSVNDQGVSIDDIPTASKELVVVVYARDGFCAFRFERGYLVEAWRSPNGLWIGERLGAPDARNVFGNLPTHTTPKVVTHVLNKPTPTSYDNTNPFQQRDLKQQLAEAARAGDLAAAISARSGD